MDYLHYLQIMTKALYKTYFTINTREDVYHSMNQGNNLYPKSFLLYLRGRLLQNLVQTLIAVHLCITDALLLGLDIYSYINNLIKNFLVNATP